MKLNENMKFKVQKHWLGVTDLESLRPVNFFWEIPHTLFFLFAITVTVSYCIEFSSSTMVLILP